VLHSKLLRILILALVLTLLAAACGKSEGEGTQTTATTEAGGISEIRFVFSPDPAWDYLKDQGILEEMEAATNYRIVDNQTWDEFGLFAGGHADIVSVGSYETPVLESELGVETVTFAKFNLARDIMIVPADEAWTTLKDLPAGCKVGVEAFVGGPTVWQALAKALDNRDLSEGSSDLQMAIADFSLIPQLVANGDFCAGIDGPSTAMLEIMAGRVKALYNSEGASQLWGSTYKPGQVGQISSNNFIALKSWYDTHPGEIAFFLQVWDRALKEFKANRDTIIADYPQHFNATTPEEIQWVIDYMNNWDWFVDSPYLTPEWIQNEAAIMDVLKTANIVPQDAVSPIYVCIDPTTGAETCRFPEGS
jgi:hypothetical protein